MNSLYDYITGFLACAGSLLYVGAKDGASEAATWPLQVKNVNGVVLGNAGGKQQFIDLFNADADNQAIGKLGGAYGPFLFELKLKCGVNPVILTGIFDVPPQTIQTASLTFASGTTVLVPITLLTQFKVGDPGAAMQDGDDTYTNSYLAGKRVLVIAGGFGLPINEFDPAVNPAGYNSFDTNDRWLHKLFSENHFFINNGVVNDEYIQIYAY